MSTPDTRSDCPKLKVFVDRSFCDLFADSIQFALLSEAPPQGTLLGPPVFARASLLLAVFSAEGAINGVLDAKISVSTRLYEKLERLPLLEKVEFIATALGRQAEYAQKAASFCEIRELVGIRNSQVHPKTNEASVIPNPKIPNEQNYIDGINRTSKLLKIPLRHHLWSFATACNALSVVDNFLATFLTDVCGFSDSEVGKTILPGARSSEKPGWQATLMQKQHYDVWAVAKARCGLKLTFLGHHVTPPDRREETQNVKA